MNTGKSDLSMDEGHSVSKRNYQTPKLVKYGLVRELTQNGTINDTEGKNDQAMGNIKGGSSRLIKENIVRIGTHPLGFGLYLYDYKAAYQNTWGHGRQFGVIAEEVEEIIPEAVSMHPDGYRMVDYGMLGVERITH